MIWSKNLWPGKAKIKNNSVNYQKYQICKTSIDLWAVFQMDQEVFRVWKHLFILISWATAGKQHVLKLKMFKSEQKPYLELYR